MLNRILLPTIAGAVLALAPAAHAGTVSVTGGELLVDFAQDGRDNVLSVAQNASTSPSQIVVRGSDVQAGPGCSPSGPDVHCPAGVTRVRALLGGGNDQLSARRPETGSLFGLTVPLAVEGQDGDDTVFDGAGDDRLLGGAGDDNLNGSLGGDQIDGQGSDDVLTGGSGNDVMDGGAGFDAFYGEEGDDDIAAIDGNVERVDCGEGNDEADRDTADDPSGCERGRVTDELERDLDGDGAVPPADCDDRNASLHPAAHDAPDNGVDENCDGRDATIRDRDGDGFAVPEDCDDNNAAVKPGNREIFGNTVDEDCVGGANPLQVIESGFRTSFVSGRRTRVRRLQVTSVKAGTTIRVRCLRRRACPLKRDYVREVKTDAKRINLRKALKLRFVKARARLEVRLVRDDSIDKLQRYRFRARKTPKISSLCQRPGARKPSRCP